MINELQLLEKLYKFYSLRYKNTILEEKFNNSVYELVLSNDIKIATYIEFCIDNNIEPIISAKVNDNKQEDMFGWDDDVIVNVRTGEIYDDFFADM